MLAGRPHVASVASSSVRFSTVPMTVTSAGKVMLPSLSGERLLSMTGPVRT